MAESSPVAVTAAGAVASIVTRRLELVSLGPAEIRAMLERRAAALARPGDTQMGESTLRRRLLQMETDPAQRPWLLRAMVERATRTLCGRIGFHAPPSDAYRRETGADSVELGYEVAPAFRRRGYAREAALALMRWAFETHGQRVFVLSISPSNAPSMSMARALGFTECGSQMDDVDGLELILVRKLSVWPPEWEAAPAA